VDGRVAGKVGGEDISVAELDANIKEELFRRASRGGKESDVYKLRQREFQRMANDLVLETEAAAQGMEPEELMTRESSRDIQVSEVQIQALYDANKGQFQGKGFDEVAPLIRNHLERQERQANAGRFLAGLRDRNQVEFVLERVRVDVVGGGPVLGSADAPVTIVEFSDYQCPYCKHAESIVSEVRNRYPDRVRFEFRHFPLEDIHPRARAAAEAATCAETQERFWEYHELVFASAAEDLSDGMLREHAGAAGLDLDAFDACVAERSGRSRVDRDLDVGREAGVDGTPTFFVNGIAITGGASADDFAKLIDEELERLRAGG
jgi:protein-disulfide isomerase